MHVTPLERVRPLRIVRGGCVEKSPRRTAELLDVRRAVLGRREHRWGGCLHDADGAECADGGGGGFGSRCAVGGGVLGLFERPPRAERRADFTGLPVWAKHDSRWRWFLVAHVLQTYSAWRRYVTRTVISAAYVHFNFHVIFWKFMNN